METNARAMMVRPREAFLPDMPSISADVIEKALTIGDMSKMPPEVRVRYYLAVCQSAGLNPLTRPFTPMKDQSGQIILYANKDCAEQLRAKHRVSVRTVSREKDGDLYLVTVEGRLPNGRSEEAQGIVDVTGLKGQALANAMMKCQTKALRRVTMALCGLGFPLADDAEYGAQPVRMDWQTGEVRDSAPPAIHHVEQYSLDEHIEHVSGTPPSTRPAASSPPPPTPEPSQTPARAPGDSGASGAATPAPPCCAPDTLAKQTLIDQVNTLHAAHHCDAIWVSRYWNKMCKRFQTMGSLDLSLDQLAGLLAEVQAYYARVDPPASAAETPSTPEPPEEQPQLGLPTSEVPASPEPPATTDPWRTMLADVLPGLEDAMLAQQAQSLLEDADASAEDGNAMVTRVLNAIEAQDEAKGVEHAF